MKRTVNLRTFAAFCLVVVIAFCVVAFSACDATRSIVDIFKDRASYKEFTDSRLEFSLPEGWSVYTSSTTSSNEAIDVNSDVGYIPSEDAFVVVKGNNLSIVKCGDENIYFKAEEGGFPGAIFPDWTGVTALRVKDGLVACKLNGQACVFDMNGREVLDRELTKDVNTQNIDTVIKILGENMVAVNPTYDVNGRKDFTSIYRVSANGCALVCRIQNQSGGLSNVYGFDNKYVLVTGNSDGDYIYDIPVTVKGQVDRTYPTENGTVSSNGESNYYKEITYIGRGRFFIYEDWTVTDKDSCIYIDDSGNNYVFKRSIYTPENDKRVEYNGNPDKVFLTLTNNYYDSSKIGIGTSSYLNDGYTYSAYGLTIIGKKAFYDQFILDDDLNIVMSLTGNYGVTINGQQKDKVGYFDLVMSATDGHYYIPLMPSEINVYDADGNRTGHNDRTTIYRQELNNNVIIAEIKDGENSSKFGAFALDGHEIIPFEYSSLASFRGAYTIGEKSENNGKVLKMIDLTGKVIETLDDGVTVPFADIATTGSNKAIYAIGCYMFKEQRGGTTYYGIKNINPNISASVIMKATMKQGSVLYAPKSAPDKVFVFDMIYEGDNRKNATYDVYRLLSDDELTAERNGLILGLSIGIPLGVIAIVAVAVVILVAIKNKRKNEAYSVDGDSAK